MNDAYARKLETIAEEIRAFCRRNADPALVKKYAIYFKEGYDAYGVPGAASEKEKKRLRDHRQAQDHGHRDKTADVPRFRFP